MKRFLLGTHRWLGLCSGIFLLAIGGSGSVLLYRHPIDRFLHPGMYAIDTSGRRLTVDSLYAIAYARHGEEFSSVSFDISPQADSPIEFTFTSRGGNFFETHHYILDLHPYTGAVLREGDCSKLSTSFVHWLMYLHDGAHFGNVGLLAAACCAITMSLSAITGLFFYGRKIYAVVSFSVPLRGLGADRFLRALHVYVAVWSLLMTFVIFFTGFWMVKGVFAPARWNISDQGKSERVQASLGACIRTSRTFLPGFSPDFVDVPLREGGTIEIDGGVEGPSFFGGGDASSVTFDPRTGGLLGVIDERNASFPASIIPSFWALHTGSYGGGFVRMLYALFGLVPGVLAISGFLMWRSRV